MATSNSTHNMASLESQANSSVTEAPPTVTSDLSPEPIAEICPASRDPMPRINSDSSTYTNTTVNPKATLVQGHVYGNVTNVYRSETSITEEDQMRQKVMETIFVTDPRDDRSHLIEKKGHRVAGTCDWILENPKYKAWLRGEAACLRISGEKGQGKTMLSIFLTQELEKTENDVVYFFCDKQDQNRNSAKAVLRGCLYHMFRQRPQLIQHGITHYDGLRRSETSVSTLLTICENVVKDPDLHSTTCIIDGIDECSEESFEAFAKGLAYILAKDLPYDKRKFKMIILSRNHHALDPFRNFPLIDLNRERDSSDVQKFISARLDELSHLSGFNEQFRERVHKILLEKSGGTFLWVGCVIEEILRVRTTTDIWETLNILPKGLPKAYTEILKLVEPRKISLLSRIIGFVCVAARPLTVAELAALFPESDDDTSDSIVPWEQRIRDHVAICPLIKVVDEQVLLIHQSAGEFLMEEEGCQAVPEFYVDSKKVHMDIAARCVAYLGIGGALGDSVALLPEDKCPLRRYAISLWPHHTRCAENQGAELLELDNPMLRDPDLLLSWLKTCKRTEPGETDAFIIGKDGHSISLLHLAAFFGLKSWLPVLFDAEISSKFDSNIQSNKSKIRIKMFTMENALGQTPIFNAVQEGHEDVVELLLEHPEICKPTDSDKLSNTPLHYATSKSIVKILLNGGAKMDISNHEGNTPLMVAAMRDEDVTRALIEAGADLKAMNDLGYTALHLANDQSISQALLDAGAEVDAAAKDGLTPLHCCKLGPQAEILIKHGAPLDIRCSTGDTPLHSAANDQILQAILSGPQADVNIANSAGDTLLHLLSQNSTPSAEVTIKLLLTQYNADPSKPNNYGSTPFHEIARNLSLRDPKNMVELFLAHGADPDTKASESSPDGTVLRGETPLIAAARLGNLLVVQALIASGKADICAQDAERNWTALLYACQICSVPVVAALLDAGAEVNTLYGSFTAMHAALGGHLLEASSMMGGEQTPGTSPRIGFPGLARRSSSTVNVLLSAAIGTKEPNRISILELLLEHGGDVHTQDGSGRTPLFTAATASMSIEAVKLLVSRGAEITARRGESQFSVLHDVINTQVGNDASSFRLARLAMATALLDLGADLEAKDADGKTPLHEAARLDKVDYDLLALLVDRGADMNATRSDGKTIVQAAVGKTSYLASQYLVERGADSSGLAVKHIIALRAMKRKTQVMELTGNLRKDPEDIGLGLVMKEKGAEEVPQPHTSEGTVASRTLGFGKKVTGQISFGKKSGTVEQISEVKEGDVVESSVEVVPQDCSAKPEKKGGFGKRISMFGMKK